MMLRRRSSVGLVLLLLAACSSNTDAPSNQPATGNGLPDISNVIYVGGTTDEALLRLLDAAAKDVAAHRAVVDAPDFGAPLSQETPATLSFHLVSQTAHTPLPAAQPTPPSPTWRRPLREFLRLLGPERVAYAHGTPYNGTAYLLVISDASAKTALRVFTNQTSYAPDPSVWQSLALAPQPLSLSITSAFFEENDIPEDGGPFVGGSFAFRVQ